MTKQELDQLLDLKYRQSNLMEYIQATSERLTTKVMVPLSRFAFIPGSIYETNSTLVSLGDNWFASQSTKDTLELFERRQEVLTEKIATLEQKLKTEEETGDDNLIDTKQFNEDGEKFFEIRESEQSEQVVDEIHVPKEALNEGQTNSRVNNTQAIISSNLDDFDRELLARIKELELEEEEASDSNDTKPLSKKNSKVSFSKQLVTEPVKLPKVDKPKSILSRSSSVQSLDIRAEDAMALEVAKKPAEQKKKPKQQIMKTEIVENDFSTTSEDDSEFESQILINEVSIAYHRKRQQFISSGLLHDDEDNDSSYHSDNDYENYESLSDDDPLMNDDEEEEFTRQQISQLGLKIKGKDKVYSI